MDKKELSGLIDQTNLRVEATEKEIASFVEDAAGAGFATVCVPPCHVPLAVKLLDRSATLVSTVAGFPLGFQVPGVKLLEARAAFDAGASEIDIVMNVSRLKSRSPAYVTSEMAPIVKALPEAVIKVIIEACYLTDREKLDAMEAVISSGADFVKTSTGFGPGGATVHDVELLAKAARGRVLVKASGGIRNIDDALAMIRAGARRLGTSRGKEVLCGLTGPV